MWDNHFFLPFFLSLSKICLKHQTAKWMNKGCEITWLANQTAVEVLKSKDFINLKLLFFYVFLLFINLSDCPQVDVTTEQLWTVSLMNYSSVTWRTIKHC